MRVFLALIRGLKTSCGRRPALNSATERAVCQPLSKALPRTLEEYNKLSVTPPLQEGKLVKVAVIGEPNVGKSTIINRLIATDVCPVSKKVHTTRTAVRVSMTAGQLQMVLLDTPGAVGIYHARRHHLPRTMVEAPSKALESCIDVLAVVVDASDHWRRNFLSVEISELLGKHRNETPHACSILILNKACIHYFTLRVDRLKSKRQLLQSIDSLCEGIVDGTITRVNKIMSKQTTLKTVIWQKEESRRECEHSSRKASSHKKVEPPDPGTYKPEFPPRYASWPHFSRVFMVSATQNDGIDDLRSFLNERSRPGRWECWPELIYKQKPKELVQDIARERLLDNLSEEIPYEVKPYVTYWTLDESGCVLHIHMSIECINERQVRAVLGPGGRTIRRITEQLRQRLCDIFHCEIALKVGTLNRKAKPKTTALYGG
ncbi:GTPase Era [Tropilaelaps mercedesae]|uniref:GTPase Era, mitochondrial n=1 Tax=Tropilaelaps mercedesae TaxID=418985 RepID=A0A1V9XQ20_9ACAR|nr:GTPase Era [Tropilaelaps mercedesae]